MGQPNIAELAVAAWRLERWLDNLNAERKMAAKSALRAIKKYLSENKIEVIDLTGSKFDVGLAVSVVNNESEETDEDKLIISEMVKPIIKEDGAVIQYGQVILGNEVKKPKENNVVEATSLSEVKEAEKQIVEAAKAIEASQDIVKEEQIKDATVVVEEKNNRSKIGFCIVGLQIVLIAISMMTFVRVGNIMTISNQPDTDGMAEAPAVSDDTSNVHVDLFSIENGMNNIDERLDSMDSDMSMLLDKITSIEGALADNEETNTDGDYIVYVVQPGDTLFKICQEHNIDFYANRAIILRMNYMDDANVLEIGQKLLLPKE